MTGAVVDLDHFTRRLLADALQNAEVGFWLRRARQLSAGLSRPEDFVGTSTSKVEIARRDARIRADLDRIAKHVELLREPRTEIPTEVIEALSNVSVADVAHVADLPEAHAEVA